MCDIFKFKFNCLCLTAQAPSNPLLSSLTRLYFLKILFSSLKLLFSSLTHPPAISRPKIIAGCEPCTQTNNAYSHKT